MLGSLVSFSGLVQHLDGSMCMGHAMSSSLINTGIGIVEDS